MGKAENFRSAPLKNRKDDGRGKASTIAPIGINALTEQD
jgi:hypothetical protein